MTERLLLCFDDEVHSAQRIAQAAQWPLATIDRHRFPDGELKLRLPPTLPDRVAILRSLFNPNEKLVELLLVARTARDLGAKNLTLITPYLGYMRQDIAFQPGEVVSQRVVGSFLASLFDGVITVDPHLHRVATLVEAVPVAHPVVLSGAPLLAQVITKHHKDPILIGPDAESAQWIEQAAKQLNVVFGVCSKQRFGDRDVKVSLPEIEVRGRSIVLLDDVASSGHTLAEATRLFLQAGAAQVDVAVTHALFAPGALQLIKDAGVQNVWSTDCIAHESNAVSMAQSIANALANLQQ